MGKEGSSLDTRRHFLTVRKWVYGKRLWKEVERGCGKRLWKEVMEPLRHSSSQGSRKDEMI